MKILKVFLLTLFIILELLSFALFAYTVSMRVESFPWSDSVSAGFSMLFVFPVLFIVQAAATTVFWILSKSYPLRSTAIISSLYLTLICVDAGMYSYYYPYAVAILIIALLLALCFVVSVTAMIVKNALHRKKTLLWQMPQSAKVKAGKGIALN